MHCAEQSISLNFGIFKYFTTLEKHEFNILAFSSSVVIDIANAIFSEGFTLSEKSSFTVSQKNLLCITSFSFKFL